MPTQRSSSGSTIKGLIQIGAVLSACFIVAAFALSMSKRSNEERAKASQDAERAAQVAVDNDPQLVARKAELRQLEAEHAKLVELARLKKELSGVKEKITAAKYDAIKIGMTYREAVGVLKQGGAEQSRSELSGITTVVYTWANPDGPGIKATFQDGKLISKAQIWLQ